MKMRTGPELTFFIEKPYSSSPQEILDSIPEPERPEDDESIASLMVKQEKLKGQEDINRYRRSSRSSTDWKDVGTSR